MSHHSISKAARLVLGAASAYWAASGSTGRTQNGRSRRGCDEGNGGITLPDELCASVYAGNLGQTWHLAVAPAGGSTGG